MIINFYYGQVQIYLISNKQYNFQINNTLNR